MNRSRHAAVAPLRVSVAGRAAGEAHRGPGLVDGQRAAIAAAERKGITDWGARVPVNRIGESDDDFGFVAERD